MKACFHVVRAKTLKGFVTLYGLSKINLRTPRLSSGQAKTFLKAKIGLGFLLQPMSQLNVGPYGRLQLQRAKPFAGLPRRSEA